MTPSGAMGTAPREDVRKKVADAMMTFYVKYKRPEWIVYSTNPYVVVTGFRSEDAARSLAKSKNADAAIAALLDAIEEPSFDALQDGGVAGKKAHAEQVYWEAIADRIFCAIIKRLRRELAAK
jgi:hypothetical protein